MRESYFGEIELWDLRLTQRRATIARSGMKDSLQLFSKGKFKVQSCTRRNADSDSESE